MDSSSAADPSQNRYSINANSLNASGGFVTGKLRSYLSSRRAKFEFMMHLKTAKQIGVTIPHSVLHRADKVIK